MGTTSRPFWGSMPQTHCVNGGLLMLHAMLTCRSIRRQFEAFAAGFKILCDGPAIRLFNACEVERLVCGNPNLDFDALERNAKYDGGFAVATPAVQWLWQVSMWDRRAGLAGLCMSHAEIWHALVMWHTC